MSRAHAESDAMSKDLAKRGFTFVGSTICYAFMQATGMVNDHSCTVSATKSCCNADLCPSVTDLSDASRDQR